MATAANPSSRMTWTNGASSIPWAKLRQNFLAVHALDSFSSGQDGGVESGGIDRRRVQTTRKTGSVFCKLQRSRQKTLIAKADNSIDSSWPPPKWLEVGSESPAGFLANSKALLARLRLVPSTTFTGNLGPKDSDEMTNTMDTLLAATKRRSYLIAILFLAAASSQSRGANFALSFDGATPNVT